MGIIIYLVEPYICRLHGKSKPYKPETNVIVLESEYVMRKFNIKAKLRPNVANN